LSAASSPVLGYVAGPAWCLLSLVWLLPVVLALNAPAALFTRLDMAATLRWLAGFGFQAGADWRLARFKADPAHRGQVMQLGRGPGPVTPTASARV
jgi:steroid 5-alpha reductase family enzyme